MKFLQSVDTSLFVVMSGTNYLYNFLLIITAFMPPVAYHTNVYPNYQNIQRETVHL